MTFSAKKFFISCSFVIAMCCSAYSQDLRRALNFAEGSTVEIVNKNGRVTVKTAPSGFGIVASSAKGCRRPRSDNGQGGR
ncbi:MAG: hypothetical protein IPG22_16035 [Acidobacteria bacterium]|nr:hypothetical protein [Acidobacteriota bacterium]